ncbi:hypothetical protein IPA_04735 [Ignicoccus pacificus DSM 13166]|uniref:Lon proteolytic domain-containing protein n=1 Tax=Ignicoccus pacificus DSM 13166 TaxID=940294 RepID=A0A977KCM7_9CREN|nr:hypothetical protein IPA_04735 [Ignicoccus pacificus DSM 13166]
MTLAVSLYKPPAGCWGYAPAVISKTEGALSNLSATVTLGTGKVYVGGPLLGNDFQGSMDGTAVASSIVAGVPMTLHNFLFYLNDLGANVTLNAAGPSGSGLAATLALAQLLNGTCTKHIAMTGMIGLGGEILPVGGVKVKAEAVKAYGLSFFLVPQNETVKVKGLEVIPISTILDSIRYMGITPHFKVCGTPKSLEESATVFKSHYERLYNLTEEVIAKLKVVSPDIQNQLRYAKLVASEGRYYAAASYAFTALIKAYTEYYKEILLNLTKGSNITSTVTVTVPLNKTGSNITNIHKIHGMHPIKTIKLPPKAEKFIKDEITKIKKYTQIKPSNCYANYWSLEACAAVYNREFRLSRYLERLSTPQFTNSSITNIASLLALAKARAVSITLWNSAVQQLADMDGAPPISNIKKVSKEAVTIGLAAAKYALSMIPLKVAFTSPINDAVDKMYQAYVNGNYAKAIGLAAYTYENAADTLMSIGNSTAVAEKILPMVMERSYCGTPSFIAYNYYGYVNSLLKTDKLSAEALSYTALFFAHLAETNAFFLHK